MATVVERPSTEKGPLDFKGDSDIREGHVRKSYQLEITGDKSAQVEFELDGQAVNASGHKDQLQRQYGIWSICGLALTIDNAWVALGGSIAIAISEPLLLRRVTVYPDLQSCR